MNLIFNLSSTGRILLDFIALLQKAHSIAFEVFLPKKLNVNLIKLLDITTDTYRKYMLGVDGNQQNLKVWEITDR